MVTVNLPVAAILSIEVAEVEHSAATEVRVDLQTVCGSLLGGGACIEAYTLVPLN